MKSYYGYIRVSTAKQGEGVSLTEQKAAIERYAVRIGLSISEWFEERETAAKRGRPVFTRMLGNLRKCKARGVVIHKIDRSARNLKDWADLAELIDAGIEVHFAADALDLNSRGGRLSADIQAVVAADYIRNLREETKKGFYGRLKQGLYPLGAPVGYLDQGGGKAKIPDPATAPFIRRAFQLYATGTYTLHELRGELVRRGFQRPKGGALHVSTLSHLLNNPFYAGIIRIKKTNQTFRGVHEPLVSISTFERVQAVLKEKLVPRITQHDFTYRRLFSCDCGRSLIGERQKGHIYYRCHTRQCIAMAVREEVLEQAVRSLLSCINLSPEEVTEAKAYLKARGESTPNTQTETKIALTLAIANARARSDRLTDAFVDGLLEKSTFEGRRATLITEIARLEEELSNAAEHLARRKDLTTRTLELAESVVLGYDLASTVKKREIVETTSSNRILRGKELGIRLQIPFEALANCLSFQSGAPIRNTSRTLLPHRQAGLRAFVDYMMQDEKVRGRSETTRSSAATSEASAA